MDSYKTVGQVAEELGVKAPAILYAHKSGRVREPEFQHGRRAYQAGDVDRLRQFFDARVRVYN